MKPGSEKLAEEKRLRESEGRFLPLTGEETEFV